MDRLYAAILLLFVSSVSAQEWTRFRGPNGSGVAVAPGLPVSWTEGDYAWIATLPGSGNSSPVVWGDRLFVTAADEESGLRFLICLDTADGTTHWQREFRFAAYKKHKNNSFASSTPCLDANHVYVLWQSKSGSSLKAFTHAGELVWEYDLGAYTHGQGGATSPILAGDGVVLSNDQKSPSFLLAVDRMTGKQLWKVPRLGKRACYSTPCMFPTADRGDELIFTHCYEGIVGIDPESGERNWHIDVFGRASQRALGSPVVTDNVVIATSGAAAGERQLVAVRPSGPKGAATATEVYRSVKMTPHVPTPLIYEGRLYIVSDQGIASCIDAESGDTVWKGRLNGNYFGSPVCVNGVIYCIDLDGRIAVFRAGSEFELLGRIPLGEGSKATPAVSGGRMFLRTHTKIFALGNR